MNNLRADLQHTAARERRLPGDALVKQRSEREQVTAAVDLFSGRLFGREVERRSHDDVATCLCGIDRLGIEIDVARGRLKQMLHESEVDHFHVTALVHEYV